jgi:hypothetical protein
MAKSRDKQGREKKKQKKPKKAAVVTQVGGFSMTSPRRDVIPPSPPGAPPA